MKNEFYKMRNPEMEEGLRDMIKWINNIRPTNEMNMIEIGSYVGESTMVFAESFKQVVSVDPYIDNYDPNDEACKYAPFDVVYEQFLKNTIPLSNIKSVRATSADALPVLSNFKWDFVYVDGIHTLDGIYFDIVNYKPLIKPGGFIAGHDYGWGNVRHILGKVFDDKIDATFKDSSWIVKL